MFDSANQVIASGTFNAAGRDINIITTSARDTVEDFQIATNRISKVNFRTLHSEALSKHTEGTGSWLLRGEAFAEWVRSEQAGAIWITGMPGAGKTTLHAMAANEVERLSRDSPRTAILCAYGRHNDKYSTSDILGAWIRQLYERHPDLREAIQSFYATHQWDGTAPSQQQLAGFLGHLISNFDKVYFFIDAIDELPDMTRVAIFQALATFQRHIFVTSRPLDAYQHLMPTATRLSVESNSLSDIELFIKAKVLEYPRLGNLLRGNPILINEVCQKLLVQCEGMFMLAYLQLLDLETSTTVKRLRVALEQLPAGLERMYQVTFNRIQAQTEASLALKAILWLTYARVPFTMTELLHALAVSNEDGTYDDEDVTTPDVLLGLCCGLVVFDPESQEVRLAHYTTYDFFMTRTDGLFDNPHAFLATSCVTYLTAVGFQGMKIERGEDLNEFLHLGGYLLADYAYNHWGAHAASARQGNPEFCSKIRTWLASMTRYPWIEGSGRLDLFHPAHVVVVNGLVDHIQLVIDHRRVKTLKLGRSPLHVCALAGDITLPICDALLQCDDLDVNAQDDDGDTPLMLACRLNNLATAERLLGAPNVDLSKRDGKGRTAVLIAADMGSSECLHVLLDSEVVDVAEVDDNGDTVLHKAVFNGRIGDLRMIMGLLLNRPTTFQYSMTPSGEANKVDEDQTWGSWEQSSSSIAWGAEEAGTTSAASDTETSGWWKPDSSGWGYVQPDWTDEGTRQDESKSWSVEETWGDVQDAQVDAQTSDPWHLRYPSVINTQNIQGDTPLTLASKTNRADLVELLLQDPTIDINIVSPQARLRSALHFAVTSGSSPEIVSLLVSRPDIDINLQDHEHNTSLHLASTGPGADLVDLLLSCPGIDVNLGGSLGNTALHQAILAKNEAAVSRLLIHPDIDVNLANVHAETPLSLAASGKCGSDQMVEMLLAHDDIQINKPGLWGATALHKAIAGCPGNELIVDLLLAHEDIDVNAQDGDGNTPLMIACEFNCEEVAVALLVRADTNIDLHNHSGETALMRASLNFVSESIMEMLISRTTLFV